MTNVSRNYIKASIKYSTLQKLYKVKVRRPFFFRYFFRSLPQFLELKMTK